MKLFSRVDMPESISRMVYDHEAVLSFDDDEGAYAFREWWDNAGLRLFSFWLADSEYSECLED